MNDNILALISARKNSKYLAKFLLGMAHRTDNPNKLEARLIMNEHDTWNTELQHFAEKGSFGFRVNVVRENHRLGRAGLHLYFNELLELDGIDTKRVDWVIYFCEDHFINVDKWDRHIREYIEGIQRSGDSDGKEFPLNADDVWVIVPKFDNCGAMNHIVSRGFIDALGGVIGNHGWIDSYINDLMRDFPDRVIRMDDELFHDFTHDKPSPMSDSHLQSETSEKGKAMPKYDSTPTRRSLAADKIKLERAIAKGARS
jgi:hypothetical protein